MNSGYNFEDSDKPLSMYQTTSTITWLLSLNFIYFTQVIQIILIMLIGTDVSVRVVFVWEETGVPGYRVVTYLLMWLNSLLKYTTQFKYLMNQD